MADLSAGPTFLPGLLSRFSRFSCFVKSALTCILLAVTAACTVNAFVMVKDGFPVCFVVVRIDAPKAERYAADELAKYLRKMTGKQVPVRALGYEDIPLSGKAVLIGQGDWLNIQRFSRSAEDLEIQGAQSYVIKSCLDEQPEALIVSGGTPRSTVYAVYELLNRLGVRWYTPDITKIPSPATVNLGDIDVCDFPCFPFRGLKLDNGDSSPEWAAHLRLNTGSGFFEKELGCKPEYLALDIPLGDLLPNEESGTEKSLMPLVNGERTGIYDMCCFTSPLFQSTAADTIIARLTQNPSVTHVVLHANHSGLFCQCADCVAEVEDMGTIADVMLSRVIRVADLVNRSYEHVTIELALPRDFSEAPEKNYFSHHTAVRICDESYDMSRPFEDSINGSVMSFVNDIRKWAQRTENITAHHRIGHNDYPALPFPDFYQTFENTLMYRNEFIQGLFFTFTSYPGILFADGELRMWVLSQLLWDSDRDGNALVKEWIRGVYGYSWGPMFDYWRHLQKIIMISDKRLTVSSDPREYITRDWLNTADRIIQRGYAQSMTDSTAHRYVRKARLSVWFTRLFMAGKKLETNVTPLTESDRKKISRILEKWEREMNELGYTHVSEEETVVEFAGALRAGLKK